MGAGQQKVQKNVAMFKYFKQQLISYLPYHTLLKVIIIVTFFSVGTLHSPSTHRKGPTPRSIEEAPELDFVISTDIKESKSSEKKTPQRGPDEKVRV